MATPIKLTFSVAGGSNIGNMIESAVKGGVDRAAAQFNRLPRAFTQALGRSTSAQISATVTGTQALGAGLDRVVSRLKNLESIGKQIHGSVNFNALAGQVATLDKHLSSMESRLGRIARTAGGGLGAAAVKVAGAIYTARTLGASAYDAVVAPTQQVLNQVENRRKWEIGISGVAGGLSRSRAIDDALVRNSANSPLSLSTLRDVTEQMAFTPALARRVATGTPQEVAAGGADMAGIISRLQLLDPSQEPNGALIAIREALAGSTRSLTQRFEIRPQDLASAAGKSLPDIVGSPEAMMAALKSYTNSMIPQSVVDAQSKLLSNRLLKIKDAVAIAEEKLGQGVYDSLSAGSGDLASKVLGFVNSDDFDRKAQRVSASLGHIVDNVSKSVSAAIAAFTGQQGGTGAATSATESATRVIESIAKISDRLPEAGTKIGTALEAAATAFRALFKDMQTTASEIVAFSNNAPQAARRASGFTDVADKEMTQAATAAMLNKQAGSPIVTFDSMTRAEYGRYLSNNGTMTDFAKYLFADTPMELARGNGPNSRISVPTVRDGHGTPGDFLSASKALESFVVDPKSGQFMDESGAWDALKTAGLGDAFGPLRTHSFLSDEQVTNIIRLQSGRPATTQPVAPTGGQPTTQPAVAAPLAERLTNDQVFEAWNTNWSKVTSDAISRLNELSEGLDAMSPLSAYLKSEGTRINGIVASDPIGGLAKQLKEVTGPGVSTPMRAAAEALYADKRDEFADSLTKGTVAYQVAKIQKSGDQAPAFQAMLLDQLMSGRYPDADKMTSYMGQSGVGRLPRDFSFESLPIQIQPEMLDRAIAAHLKEIEQQGVAGGFSDRQVGTNQMNYLRGAQTTALALRDRAQKELQADPTSDSALAGLAGASQSLDQVSSKLKLLEQQIDPVSKAFVEMGADIRSAFQDGVGNALEGLYTGTMKLQDAFKSMGRSLIAAIAQMQSKLITQGLMGDFGTQNANGGSNPAGGLMGGLLSIFGGASGAGAAGAGAAGAVGGLASDGGALSNLFIAGLAAAAADGAIFQGGFTPVHKFSDGGIVKGGKGTLGLIGEAGYGHDEAVIPLKHGNVPVHLVGGDRRGGDTVVAQPEVHVYNVASPEEAFKQGYNKHRGDVMNDMLGQFSVGGRGRKVLNRRS